MSYRREIRYDYKVRLKSGGTGGQRFLTPRMVRGTLFTFAICAVAYGLTGVIDTAPARTTSARLALELPAPLLSTPAERAAIKLPFEPQISPAASERWQSVDIKSGYTASYIFDQLKLNKVDLHRILDLGGPAASLKRLRPQQQISVRVKDGELLELIHEQDPTSQLRVFRSGEKFIAEQIRIEPERRIATAKATIDSSLFLTGQSVGLSDNVIMQLAAIFGWDIDFVLDIRNGDSFALIYDELLKDGRKIKDGTILAAEFTNRDRTFRAVRYIDSKHRADYYSDNGRSMRKAFLRTPVKFSRISSRFNLRRKHPILNTIRAHRGVDYAAPSGTPVKATGDGKIILAGNNGGYGRTVVLQHGGRYSTLYAHLSRIGRSIKVGRTVKQGQIIGYVGSTGLATGPHLHYEFRVGGVHRNPLTVQLPRALPIPQEQLAAFEQQTSPLLTALAHVASDQPEAIDRDALLAHLNAIKPQTDFATAQAQTTRAYVRETVTR